MPFRRHLTVEEASRAIGLLQSGLSQRQVGERFNVSHSVNSRLLARFQQTNSVKQRQKSGLPRKTTVRQDRQIVLLAKRNRMSSVVSLKRDVRTATGVRMSVQTVRNRLHASGLHARKPAVRPSLTADHRNRRQFGRDHVNWCVRNLRPFIHGRVKILPRFQRRSAACLETKKCKI